jgi:hypothetical protein
MEMLLATGETAVVDDAAVEDDVPADDPCVDALEHPAPSARVKMTPIAGRVSR